MKLFGLTMYLTRIVLMYCLVSNIMADSDDKQEYSKHIDAIKGELEQKHNECTNKKECACYQEKIAYFDAYAIKDIEVQIFSELSSDEQRQLRDFIVRHIDSQCKGIVPHKKWSDDDWELVIKIAKLHWRHAKATTFAEYNNYLRLMRRLAWFKISSKNPEKIFKNY